MGKISIIVADDQMLTREGLRTILDLEEDMRVIGTAKNGEEVIKLVEALHPDCVLIFTTFIEENEQYQAFEAWKFAQLSEREEELARLIIRGMNNREIAAILHISEGTARIYISKLYSKLDVSDRVQAIVRLQTLIGIMK